MLNMTNRHRAKRADGERGFTLIELLVVVVIIGILIAIAVPLYLNYRKGANDKAAQSDLRNAISVLEVCYSDNSAYPASITANTSGGACTGQTINTSAGTTISYYPVSSTDLTGYVIGSTNSNGTSGRYFCYSSKTGGSVAQTTTAVTQYRLTC